MKVPRSDGSTALMWAASRADGELVTAMLRHGAKVNVADENGETALLAACTNGNLAIARALLDSKADPANPNAARWNGETPLLMAVNAGNLDLVKLLLDRGARVDAAESRLGQTPLMWAAEAGRPQIVNLLIEKGANVNAVSKNGFSPLLFAAQRGDVNSAKALLAAKADPKFKAKDGSTAFFI